MLIIDPSAALEATTRISACGALIASLEMITVRREFGEHGVFSRAGIMSLYRYDEKSGFKFVDKLAIATLGISIVSYITLILQGPFQPLGVIAIMTAFLCRNIILWRRLIGGDGAEQITTLTLAATLLAVVPEPSPQRINLAVSFIGAQLILSYVTAGITKFSSPVWRRGDVLCRIMDTETYGQPWIVAVLRRFPRVATMLSWLVILFQCSFLLLLAGPSWMAFGALALGLGFHLAVAVTMGINNFLWAFPATYPCVVVLGAWISPFW